MYVLSLALMQCPFAIVLFAFGPIQCRCDPSHQRQPSSNHRERNIKERYRERVNASTHETVGPPSATDIPLSSSTRLSPRWSRLNQNIRRMRQHEEWEKYVFLGQQWWFEKATVSFLLHFYVYLFFFLNLYAWFMGIPIPIPIDPSQWGLWMPFGNYLTISVWCNYEIPGCLNAQRFICFPCDKSW